MGGTVDVLVLGTSPAVAAAGGFSAFQTVAISAIAYANNVHSVSGTSTQLRLVGVVQFDGVSDSLSSDLCGSMLHALDGNDAAENLRNYYGADLVALVGSMHDPVVNGRYISGCTYESGKYSVNYLGDFNTNLTHETGHDLGAGHSPADNNGPGAYSYAYAFEWDTIFGPCIFLDRTPNCTVTTGTIMSNTGHKIAQFSRPSGSYDVACCCPLCVSSTTQSPLGSATQNNALAISQQAPIVAAYNPRNVWMDPNGSVIFADGPSLAPTPMLGFALAWIESGGTIYLQTGTYHATGRVSTPCKMVALGGPAHIGP